MWANYRYNNKKEIDLCYKERSEFKENNELLKKEIKELEEKIKELNKELEQAHREIAEKNKYLSEDKVIVERLFEIKQLSDNISNILMDYDKETIQHLLSEYKKWELCDIEKNLAKKDEKIEEENEKKLWW